MPGCLVISGLQWGDEGKGKVTDLLSGEADLAVRFQGGANAGHTVVVEGRRVVLHLIPSGILNPSCRCLVGPAVVVDPETLVVEIESLRALGVPVTPDRLLLSPRANLVLPWHHRLDQLREAARSSARIGTTGRGIGPAYEDLFGRNGVRLAELLDRDRLADRVARLLPERNALIRHHGGDPLDAEEVLAPCLAAADRLGPFIRPIEEELTGALSRGRRMLLETAQGTLLDVLHGTWPFVTSSLTLAPAAFPLLGIGIPPSFGVLGVVKAYTTRVGEGPFPSEDRGALGQALRDRGQEYGSTTGRPRRCGLLDLPSLRHAVRANGVTALAVTKMDVLSGLAPTIPVVRAWRHKGRTLDLLDPGIQGDPDLVPVHEEWPLWEGSLEGIRCREDLPSGARVFLDRLEAALAGRLLLGSTGPARESTCLLADPWR